MGVCRQKALDCCCLGQQANQERVSNGRIVCDYGIKGSYYVGTGEVRNDEGVPVQKHEELLK